MTVCSYLGFLDGKLMRILVVLYESTSFQVMTDPGNWLERREVAVSKSGLIRWETDMIRYASVSESDRV